MKKLLSLFALTLVINGTFAQTASNDTYVGSFGQYNKKEKSYTFSLDDSAATTVKKNKKSYVVVVTPTTGKSSKGILTGIDENRIEFTGSRSLAYAKITYAPEHIQTVTVRRKGSVGRGILIGAAVGLFVGAIGGFAEGDDKEPVYDPYGDPLGLGYIVESMFYMTAEDKALAYGLTGGLTGAIIGGVVGAVAKKKFTIGGRKENYVDMQDQLMKKLIVK